MPTTDPRAKLESGFPWPASFSLHLPSGLPSSWPSATAFETTRSRTMRLPGTLHGCDLKGLRHRLANPLLLLSCSCKSWSVPRWTRSASCCASTPSCTPTNVAASLCACRSLRLASRFFPSFADTAAKVIQGHVFDEHGCRLGLQPGSRRVTGQFLEDARELGRQLADSVAHQSLLPPSIAHQAVMHRAYWRSSADTTQRHVSVCLPSRNRLLTFRASRG